jgi:hypothetical protein
MSWIFSFRTFGIDAGEIRFKALTVMAVQRHQNLVFSYLKDIDRSCDIPA